MVDKKDPELIKQAAAREGRPESELSCEPYCANNSHEAAIVA